MNEVKKSVGKRIARLRNDAGLTQSKLAEMIGIHEKNLSSIELGKYGVSMETLIALCEKLNVSADYILFGEKKEIQTHHFKTWSLNLTLNFNLMPKSLLNY